MNDFEMLKNDFIALVDESYGDMDKEEYKKHLKATIVNHFDFLEDTFNKLYQRIIEAQIKN